MPNRSAVRALATSTPTAWRSRSREVPKEPTAAGTFLDYPALVTPLPPLVRKQRRLEGKIAPLSLLVDEEKACRAEIDLLLIAAGIEKGKCVTCAGYDVTHVERVGTKRLNQETLIAKLIAAGLDQPQVLAILEASTETGDPFTWATVKPSKGAKVRT
jgi:hypothetical protein